MNVSTDQKIFIPDLFGKQLKTLDSELSGHVNIDVNDLPLGTCLVNLATENKID